MLNISLFKEIIQLKQVSIIPKLFPSLGIVFINKTHLKPYLFDSLGQYKSCFIVKESP